MIATKSCIVSKRQLFGVCLLSMLLTACSGGSGGGTSDNEATESITETTDSGTSGAVASVAPDLEVCSVADINRWVDERMRDTYIYYDQVPLLDLDQYDDSRVLLDDLRVLPDIYSSLVDQEQDEQVIGNSTVTRFGFWLQDGSDGGEHFASISGNSPMENAGITRGDELLAINGVPIEEVDNALWQEFIVGELGEELTAVFTVRSATTAAVADFEVTKTTYIESTVPVWGTYESTNDQVGYLQVTAFRGTTEAEIDTAVAGLASAGISELILDLRYNGGGFTRTARKLASQIAGQGFVGEVYSKRVFNDKYSSNNLEQFIEPQLINLNLSRVIVLTTSATASASETLINGLAPMIDVAVMGTLTEGKPFTSVAQDYCGKRLNAMSTLTTNGIDESVLGGITPTCRVIDDYLAPTDSPSDALTGAAFAYLQSGACPAVQSKVSQLQERRG